ncbi:acetate--CoA ligase [Candidatus Sumerlaeota bacterium]|nr:acetate--CoA ligase [Candidatus Sumerlaeota bacterium]
MTEKAEFANLLQESRMFEPSEAFKAQANVNDNSLYERADEDFEGYWEDRARELEWFQPWNTVLTWEPPHCKWFEGGKLNICHNALDRHLDGPRRNKAAIIWEGENYDTRTLTYLQLHREVCQFANVLKGLGVKKGDRVAIYLPMVVEAAVAMLACARIGAIHSVVFGGFAPESLRDRINDCEAKVLVTEDGSTRRGKALLLKDTADKALEETPCIKKVVVVKRPYGDPYQCTMKEGRDLWYHDLMAKADTDCPCEEMDAEDPLFILYTSGTTGKPKGVVHTTGGYAVGAHSTCKYVFDMKDTDIFWCTADVGWVTGHTYIAYGPLMNGVTQIMFEGVPNHPHNGRFWEVIEKYRVTIFYTAPTAIRAFMKWGEEIPQKFDLSSLRLLGSVGEPINPEAWIWYHTYIGREGCPIVDTWWQTETGSILMSNLPGVNGMKPGKAGLALPGVCIEIVDDQCNPLATGSGLLVIKKPWPSMLRTIWGDDQRLIDTYFSKWDIQTYFAGDGATRDEDGYIMVLGRVDDVLNVSGHRIGTMEIESVLVEHPKVAEAAVVGKQHEIKGQAIVAYVSYKGDVSHVSEADIAELKKFVADKIGAIARPDEIYVSHDLPKTRSGKIMRRLLRDIAEGRELGDTTTLADPSVVEEIRKQLA